MPTRTCAEPSPESSSGSSISAEELLEEERKLRRLRIIVDMTRNMILQQPINYEEAYELVKFVKREALQLFPGKEETFDIIYRPRFNRLLNEKFKTSVCELWISN